MNINHAVMKFLTIEKQSANNIYECLTIVLTGTVPHLVQLLPDWSLNLNVAKDHWKIIPMLDGHAVEVIVREFVTGGFKMRKNSRILTIF